jgi:hypothetical protein
LEVHQAVFALILGIVEAKGLLKGRVLGADSTYVRADTSMKAIVGRDTREGALEFVTRLAEEADVATFTAEDARRLDRKRTGQKTSNRAWVSRTDHDARIAQAEGWPDPLGLPARARNGPGDRRHGRGGGAPRGRGGPRVGGGQPDPGRAEPADRPQGRPGGDGIVVPYKAVKVEFLLRAA